MTNPTPVPTRLYLAPVPAPAENRSTQAEHVAQTAVYLTNLVLITVCGAVALAVGVRDLAAGWPFGWELLYRGPWLVWANPTAFAVAAAGLTALEIVARQLWAMARPEPLLIAEPIDTDVDEGGPVGEGER
jgi:hypothetical protein